MSARGAQATTPQGLDDTWVWEAFRTLRTEGISIHRFLAERVLPGLLHVPGDTLEIGGGDAHLWIAGGEQLVEATTAAGRLVITDFDPELVTRCRTHALLGRPGVEIVTADATALPQRPSSFVRAIATHVLHWCGAPDTIARAVSELARVLRDDGVAIVTTVAEDVHMRELYVLLGVVRQRLVERGLSIAGMPSGSPRVLPFCASNAEAFLSNAFLDVRRVDCTYAHLVDRVHPQLGVRGAEFMVAYVRTLPFVREALQRDALPEEFFEELDRALEAAIAASGLFRMSRCDVVYICTRPRRTREDGMVRGCT